MKFIVAALVLLSIAVIVFGYVTIKEIVQEEVDNYNSNI